MFNINPLNTFLLFIVILCTVCLGCSSAGQNPVDTSADTGQIELSDTITSDHALIGMWELALDSDSFSYTLLPDRSSMAHYNVTGYLPFPGVTLVIYDPITAIWTIDVKVRNTFSIDGHDLRLIIYSDDFGSRLMNPDNWTGLHDIAGGGLINPFKAYAKEEPNRTFTGLNEHMERLLLYLPGGTGQVKIAIDASYPGNCGEPYRIADFAQDPLYNIQLTSSDAYFHVYDWQDDVSSVMFYCPSVIGTSPVACDQLVPNYWHAEIRNNLNAGIGRYMGLIIANSSGGTLYDVVDVNVTEAEMCPEDDTNHTWETAYPLGMSFSLSGCIDPNASDWFIIYLPPNGTQTGQIDIDCLYDDVELSLYGSYPGDDTQGTLLQTGVSLAISNDDHSRYLLEISSDHSISGYDLSGTLIPKLARIDVDIYVATDDGTEYGTWPLWEIPDPDEELSMGHISNQISWCNTILDDYGYQLHWDGSVTILFAYYYNLDDWNEEQAMRQDFGSGTGRLSMYFVNMLPPGAETAYCWTASLKEINDVGAVYSVYGPNVWYWKETVAHEHGHGLGYLFDQYIFALENVPCGDEDSLPSGYNTFLYSDPDACYYGNLMFFSIPDWPLGNWELTDGQSQNINQFHFEYPDNFPFY